MNYIYNNIGGKKKNMRKPKEKLKEGNKNKQP